MAIYSNKPSFFKVFIAILSIVILILTINSIPVHAAPLSQLSYQGRLTNSSGTVISDGTYGIQFSIYTQADGGSSVWSETQNITTNVGIFSAVLGASNPINLDFNSSSKYYLGIKVGTDSEMSPRSQIGAAPFAVNSKYLNGAQGGTGANNLLQLNSSGEIDITGGIKTTGILQAGTSTLSSLTVTNNITLQGGILDLQDHSISNIDTLGFNDVVGTIAGIQNQNLLDKTADETISGSWTFSNPLTFSSMSLSSATANPVLSVNNSTGTNDIVRFLDNGVSVLTIANGGLATFAGNIDATSGLDVSGAALTVASQPITQTGSGQVTFAGNVDVSSGLDISGGALTVANQAITQTTGGQITFAGNVDANSGLDVNGAGITLADGNYDISINNTSGNNEITTSAGALELNAATLIQSNVNFDATAGLDVTGADFTVGGANFSVTTAGLLTTVNDIAVNGGDITSTAAAFNIDAVGTGDINIGNSATGTGNVEILRDNGAGRTIYMGNGGSNVGIIIGPIIMNSLTGTFETSGTLRVTSGGSDFFVANGGNVTIGDGGAAITRHLSSSSNITAAAAQNIPATSCATYATIAVVNSTTADTVVATPTPVAGGIETVNLSYNAYVSVAGTVTIRACNPTGAGIDVAADQTWRADVWQH